MFPGKIMRGWAPGRAWAAAARPKTQSQTSTERPMCPEA